MKIVVNNISHVHKGRLIFVGSVIKVADITFPKTEPLLFRENELFKRRIYRNQWYVDMVDSLKIFLFDPADFKKFIKGSKRAVAGDLLFFENHITNVYITMHEDINF